MKAPIDDKILDAALKLAAQKPWDDVTLSELAISSSLSLDALRGEIEDKNDVLAALHERLDRQMLEATAFEGSVKERLFDLLMSRFDSMQRYRKGYVSMLEAVKYQPAVLAKGACLAFSSMGWMLEAAGAASSDLSKGILSLVYLNALRVWMADGSADLSATMAAVDQGLVRAEKFIQT